MRKLIAIVALAILFIAPQAMAQWVKPADIPTTQVPGGITIGVWAAGQPIDGKEYIGVFEQHADTKWYYTGLGTTPITPAEMNSFLAAFGGGTEGAKKYLSQQVLPVVNADIIATYYGSGPIPVPPPGSDPVMFLNYSLGTDYLFGLVNGHEQVVGR